MTTISGSEVAKLVLRYLQSQKMETVALEFCRSSPYLREEYGILKRGLKLKELSKHSLIDVIKDYIEIEEIVTELFQNELDRYDRIPYDLLRARTLKDKLLYLYGSFSENKGQSSQSQNMGVSVGKKRSNVCIVQSDYNSDSSDISTPRATDEQDLPGYNGSNRPPRPKRRKYYDPSLLYSFNDKSEVVNNDGIKSEVTKATPSKPSGSFQDPTSTKKLIPIHGEKLSETLLSYMSPRRIAQQINSGFGEGNISLDQLPEKLEEIVTTFDDIVESLHLGEYENSSSGASKAVSDAEFDNERQLETPLPIDSSKGCRYDLRSNRKSNSNLASTELKRKRNSKIQILSDEQINPPESGSEIVVVSDEEPVSTTSQSQQVQQTQFQAVFYNGMPFIPVYDADTHSIKLTPITQDRSNFTNEQMQPLITNIQNQTLSNVIESSGFMITDQSNNQIINIVDNNTIIGSNIISNPFITETTSNQAPNANIGGENRMIVVVPDDVNKEGTQPLQVNQQSSSEILNEAPKERSQEVNTNQTKDKPNPMAQFKVISGQKVVTPKQLIKPNFPSSSRSLSTPRDKIKKVLDFNTPNRFRLTEIVESKNESGSNTSRFFSETPHNRTITSSLPRSAPPKVDSAVQSRRESIEKSIETNEVFVPTDENTVVSVEGETPKVRKNNRRSCVRTISAHKEINPEENEKRLNRVAVAKKKICPDDADSNDSEKAHKNDKSDANVDATDVWKKIQEGRKKPIDQQMRELNSQKEESEMPTGRKRSRRSRKKPPPKKGNNPTKAATDKLTKSDKTLDVSFNSSPDVSFNSTLQNESLLGKMLEDNLKSTKKITPMKQKIHKSAKKKTPIGNKVQIKLPTKSPKNKALKKMKSAKNLVATQKTDDTVESVAVSKTNETEADNKCEAKTDVQTIDQAQINVSENTTDDLEVAQNLINMQEVILQQESEKKKAQHPPNPVIQSDSVSMSVPQPVVEVTVGKTMSQPMSVDKISSTLLKSIANPNLSMSALLETPYKDNGLAFPRTSGLNSILPQLTTPMILRPCESLMDDSIFKNPQFPTPNFPINPGSIFTPFKDMLSPQGEEVVYGAPNRPTDYSSSSSYYKPDESDGIDKQIQASVRSAQTNSGVYSADEIDESSKIDDTTQNTSRASSSSSSSSSSDSDSDSDSDSSSSSDSETSQISQKALEPIADAESNQPSIQPVEIVDEDTTQIIKSHLVSTADTNIAQNILLSEPEAPIVNKEAEQIKLLEEKRRRMQESLRQDEMKNREKMKPKQTKKYQRNINEAKRERLRVAPTIVSPSKRKSSQPMKVVSIENNQQIYSQVKNVVSKTTMKTAEVKIKTQCVTTERLISEAAGDNAIVDAFDVSTTQNARPVEEEESIEAIQRHVAKTEQINIAPTQLSPEDLVGMISEKQKKFNANRPKTKTEVIAPLPLTRATRARTRSQKIRPISTILSKPTDISSKVTTKPSVAIKEQRRSTDNNETNKPNQKSKTIAKKCEQVKTEPFKNETVKTATCEEKSVKPECSLVTPAKKKITQQIRDIFGDCTDIDTPIKSPPKNIAQKKPEEQSKVKCDVPTKQLRKSPRTSPVQQIDKPSTKYEADSSTVQDESDDSDDSDSDDDTFELVLSIDESDKRRFLSVRENASVMSKVAVSQTTDIKPWKLNIEGVNVVLAASDIDELYMQDVDSVAEMKRGRRSGKEIKTEVKNEPSSSSEAIYGKPLHTSTPSPTKTITPKFNIKHKTSTTVSPKSAKKHNSGKGENYFNGIKIDDVLFHLHPTNE